MTIPTTLLSSGHEMPLLGLGTWPLDDHASAKAVAGAIGLGYRLIDTASRYENEIGVGQGIAASGVDRAELFVTTKLRGDDQGYDTTRDALRGSLDRLGLDYVDLYLVHWPLPRLDGYVESYRAMIDLAAEGLIRSVGVSNFREHHLDRLIAETSHVPAVNQIQLSPALARTGLRRFLTERGITVEGWSPLGHEEGVLDEPVIQEIAATHGRTVGQVVLRWHVQQGIVTIPKSASPERQRANAEIFDFELTDDDMTQIASLDRGEDAARDSDEHEEF
ncbi:aldo/keto reductase [Oerskovia sp. USHLN155]|uniref:aldo/keto reductase n=1 Tax=Oerskovia sp. USHLN155 TaxID=3081288 RepID=UPI003019CFA7